MCSSVNLKSHPAISFNQKQRKYMCGLIVVGDLPKWKKIWKVKSGLIVMGDLPRWKNVKNYLIVMGDLPKWSEKWKWFHCYGWSTQVERKCEEYSRCNRWPTQIEWKVKVVSLLWVTYPSGNKKKLRFFKNNLIVMGDLPRRKNIFKVKNAEIFQEYMWLG
jgi:hypothetical protein